MKSVFLPSPQVENSFATLSTERISPSPTRSGPLFTQVMKGKRRPMRVPAIIAAGVPLATSLKGKTPAQTFYSMLYSESKKADGLVVQTGKGEFRLNPKRATRRHGQGRCLATRSLSARPAPPPTTSTEPLSAVQARASVFHHQHGEALPVVVTRRITVLRSRWVLGGELKEARMTRTRLAVATAGCALAAVLAPLGAAGSGKPSYGCPPGFDLGSMTFAEYLALPRNQAVVNDGLATAEQILAGVSALDKNANGSVCVQLNHGLEVSSKPFAAYFYNVVDDNASVP